MSDYDTIFVFMPLAESQAYFNRNNDVTALEVYIDNADRYRERKRGHPWAEAVSVGGWVTLIFGFVFWPLVMIWAYVDVPAKREANP